MYAVTTRHFIIATAGHVDHGKSALVKALTGTDPDRLPEERKRQITIDLGFAELNLTSPDGDRIHAGVVDVPGHEDFVRNMIAGIGSIDLALFVVAADDGWMPQTEEHLQILSYLGVQRAVIAVTKSDLGRVDVVTDQIRSELHGTAFANSPIVPTSVRTGTGVERLTAALATELSSAKAHRNISKPRLFIDRVFTLRGVGTIVTGTLTGGVLRRGQQIIIYPANLETRIRSIQSHGIELEVAQPGMRTAINLPDIPVDQIKRGDVVTVPSLGEPDSTLVVLLEKSSRLDREDRVSSDVLSKTAPSYMFTTEHRGLRPKLRCEKMARLKPAKKELLNSNSRSPIFAFVGDRFVLRDSSEQHTIAGGLVLDPDGNGKSLTFGFPLDDVDSLVRLTIKRRGFAHARKSFEQITVQRR